METLVLTVMLTANAWHQGYEIIMATPTTGPTVVSEPYPGLASCENAMSSRRFLPSMNEDPWLATCRPVLVFWRFERTHR